MNTLAPEEHVDLQIALDRLRDKEDRCRDALRNLASGTLTRDAYLAILRQQLEAHQAWAEQHQKYFGRVVD